MSDMDLLDEFSSAANQRSRFYGVTVGLVTNNKDPEGLGRLKIKFPWLSEQEESHWARVLTPMAGQERGLYFLPEVDDEVLVAFEHGDVNFPYILGSLWNGKDKPPASNSDGKNNLRTIKSRSGHVITLDDTRGEEKIIVRDMTQKNEIVLDSKHNTLSVKVDGELTIETRGKITIKSTSGDLEIDCNNLKVQARQSCEIKANQDVTVQANAQLTLKGPAGVKINDGALEVM